MKSLIISLIKFIIIISLMHIARDFQDYGNIRIGNICFFTSGFLVSFQAMDLFKELKSIFSKA